MVWRSVRKALWKGIDSYFRFYVYQQSLLEKTKAENNSGDNGHKLIQNYGIRDSKDWKEREQQNNNSFKKQI